MKTGKSKRRIWALGAATAGIVSTATRAANFLPTASGNWSVPTNWSGSIAPGAGNTADATIGSGGVANINGTFSPQNVNLLSGGVTGTGGSVVNVGGQFHWVAGTIGNGASLIINGSANLADATDTLINAGTLTFNVTPVGMPKVAINNSGTITLGSGVTLTLINGSTTSGQYRSTDNTSTLRFGFNSGSSGTNVHTVTGSIAAGTVQIDQSDFTLAANASITANSTTFGQELSALRGGGTFHSPVSFDRTSIFAGDDGTIGTLHFGSTASLTNDTTLSADITTDQGNDLLDITGSATINDLLIAAYLSDGTVPRAGQSFTIIHAAGGIVGAATTMFDPASFDADGFVPAYDAFDPDANGANGEFALSVTATDVLLTYVPEPSLLIPAVLSLLAGRRRRLP